MKKKGFIIVLILIVIAVVLTIVFVNLFKEKNTDKLSSNIHSVANEGYLNVKNTEDIDAYLGLLLESRFENAEVDKNVVKNYQDALKGFEKAIAFFDQELFFSTYTDEYKNNRKAIENDFSQAQKATNDLVKYIKANMPNVGASTDWAKRTWQYCDEPVATLINSTADAYSRIFDVYQASVSSSAMRNQLTQLVFDHSKQLLKNLVDNPTVAKTGEDISSFFGAYFSESGASVILKYNFNDKLKDFVKDVQEKGSKSQKYQSFLAGFAGEVA